eukprot:scaffold297698_cov24-Tisochrysis_lutea.AAC.2
MPKKDRSVATLRLTPWLRVGREASAAAARCQRAPARAGVARRGARGDPSRDGHANGTEFSVLHPHARLAGPAPARRDAEARCRSYHRLLETLDVPVDGSPKARQV